MFLKCDDGFYSQGYGQTNDAFRALTKKDTLNPYTTDQDFNSTNVNTGGEATDYTGYG